MGTFLLILGWILSFIIFVWYFTCTKHKDVPLALVLIDFIISLIPVMNWIFLLVNIGLLCYFVDEEIIELKNNWFNRTFLAYNE